MSRDPFEDLLDEAVGQWKEAEAERRQAEFPDSLQRELLEEMHEALYLGAELASGGSDEGASQEVWTLEEVAQFLRISMDDLELELDTLPVFAVGAQVRVRRQALMEWIQSREDEARRRHELSLVFSAPKGNLG